MGLSLDSEDDEPEETWHVSDVRVVFVACESLDGSPKIVFDGVLEFEASTNFRRPRLRHEVMGEL